MEEGEIGSLYCYRIIVVLLSLVKTCTQQNISINIFSHICKKNIIKNAGLKKSEKLSQGFSR